MAQPWKIQGLDPEAGVPVCLKKVVRTRTKEVFSYRPLVMGKDDADGIHDMRVAVRRLNAILVMFHPWFKPKRIKKQGTVLKALLRDLGKVRDGDIFAAFLAQYREHECEANRPALDLFIEQERSALRVYRKRLRRRLRGLHRGRIVEKLEAAFANSSSLPPVVSFREHARSVLPSLLDTFLAHGAEVVAHPRQIKRLHAMRIDGKRLRYGMEIFAACFGSDYSLRLEEIKSFLDVMGEIHDCDVHVPAIVRQIQKTRAMNADRKSTGERIRTRGLTLFKKDLQQRRGALFAAMAATLRTWELNGFAGAVNSSMK